MVGTNFQASLHDRGNELPLISERMTIGNVEKLVVNLKDKCKCLVHIRAHYKAIQRGLKL